MENHEMTFRQTVKIALIQREMKLNDLAKAVNEATGKHYDGQYLLKVMDGRVKSYPAITAICELLGLDIPDSYYTG
jgi:hypothetical protein